MRSSAARVYALTPHDTSELYIPMFPLTTTPLHHLRYLLIKVVMVPPPCASLHTPAILGIMNTHMTFTLPRHTCPFVVVRLLIGRHLPRHLIFPVVLIKSKCSVGLPTPFCSTLLHTTCVLVHRMPTHIDKFIQ